MAPRTFGTVEEQSADERGVLDSFKAKERAMVEGGNYAQLLCSALLSMVDSSLSREGLRLGLYLFSIYPYVDSYVKLPSQAEFAMRLGVSRQTINAAQAALEATGVWRFKIGDWHGKNMAVKPRSAKEKLKAPPVVPEFEEPQPVRSLPEAMPTAITPTPKEPERSQEILEPQPQPGIPPKTILSDVFVWEVCDWGQAGVDSRFWPYLIERTRSYSDRRVANGHKQVDNPQEYALTMIQRDGEKLYRDFEIAVGLRQSEVKPDAKAKAEAKVFGFSLGEGWREGMNLVDLSETISQIKIYWQELRLSWEDARLARWLAEAQAIAAFEVGPGALYGLPDWVLWKLAYDMRGCVA